MIHPDDLDRVLDSPLPLNVEYRMWARDRWKWVWEHEVGDFAGGRSQGVVVDITVRKEAEIALQEFRLGASIGIALGPGPGIDAGELLRRADAAMYEAKQAGRASCAVFGPDDQDRHAKLILGARLRRAGQGGVRAALPVRP